MTKKSVKLIIAVLMILTIALYFISGTYARYVNKYTGEGSISVANWAVALKSGEQPVAAETLDLTFKPVSNQYVVSGKIAPDVELEADVEIDLTGTEVAVDITATANDTEIKSALADTYGTVPERITVESKLYNGEEYTNALEKSLVELPGGAFTSENGKMMLKIKVKWVHEENDAKNTDDTNAGKAAKAGTLDALKIPVTLTVQQHVKSDG